MAGAPRRLALTLVDEVRGTALLEPEERLDALTRSLSLGSIDLHSWDLLWSTQDGGRQGLTSSALAEAVAPKPGSRRRAFDRRASVKIQVLRNFVRPAGEAPPELRPDFAESLRDLAAARKRPAPPATTGDLGASDKGKGRAPLPTLEVSPAPAASPVSPRAAHPTAPASPSPRTSRLSGSGFPASGGVAAKVAFSDPAHQAAHEALQARLKALQEAGVETDKGALRAGRLMYVVCVLGMWLEYACYRSAPAPSAADVQRQVQAFLFTYEKACAPLELLTQLASLWRQPPAFWTAANTLIQEKETRPDRVADIVLLRRRAQILLLSHWLSPAGTWPAPARRAFLSEPHFAAALQSLLAECNAYYAHQPLCDLERRLLAGVTAFAATPPAPLALPAWVAEELHASRGAAGSGVPKGGWELMGMSESELADQLTLINHADWLNLDLSDLLYMRYEKTPNTGIRTIDVRAQGVLHWLLTEILTCAHLPKRAAVVTKIISTARALKKRGNFQGMYVFVCALTQGPVLRLDKTFAALSGSTRKKQAKLMALVHKPPYKEYRALLHKREAEHRPYVPVLQVMKDDLLRLNELPMFLDERDFDTKNFINFAGRVMSLGGYKEALEPSRRPEWYAYHAATEAPRARALRQYLRTLEPRGSDADFYRMAKQIELKTSSS